MQRQVAKSAKLGDWSNGMIGVSKTFGGSSILSSPVFVKPWKRHIKTVSRAFSFHNLDIHTPNLFSTFTN